MAKKSRLSEFVKTAVAGVGALSVVGGILWVVEKRMGNLPAPPFKAVQKPVDQPAPIKVVIAKKEPTPEPKPEPVPVAPPPAPIEAPPAPVRSAAQILVDLKLIPRRAGENELKRAALIGELYKVEPSHRQIPDLLVERWITLKGDPEATEERAAAKDGPIGNSAAFVAAYLNIEAPSVSWESARKSITVFANRSRGKSPSTAELLGKLADEKTDSIADQKLIYASIIEGFPGSPAAQKATARLVKIDQNKFQSVIDPEEAANDPRIGQIFQFMFRDAISGDIVSSDALRGHVMVVDFWATWCPPCVASVPHLKEMYAKYAPQGVVFIGVSHDDSDQAGLRKMLNFVYNNQMPWAQFHQSKRELSKIWGVSGIPTVFLIDQEGRVVTKQGNWDKLIPKLLADGNARKPAKTAKKK